MQLLEMSWMPIWYAPILLFGAGFHLFSMLCLILMGLIFLTKFTLIIHFSINAMKHLAFINFTKSGNHCIRFPVTAVLKFQCQEKDRLRVSETSGCAHDSLSSTSINDNHDEVEELP